MLKKIFYVIMSVVPAVMILGVITVAYHRFLPEEYHMLLDNELSNVETGLIGIVIAWVTNRLKK